ncbi:unnamed protein product, partial [Polarella glacialis]
ELDYDSEVDSLMRLKPLLNEADALRAERTSLEAEQNDLVFALKEAGVTLPGLAEVTMPHPNLDQELELRLRTAVEGVLQENDSLK